MEDALLLLRDRRNEKGSLALSLAVGLLDDPSECAGDAGTAGVIFPTLVLGAWMSEHN